MPYQVFELLFGSYATLQVLQNPDQTGKRATQGLIKNYYFYLDSMAAAAARWVSSKIFVLM